MINGEVRIGINGSMLDEQPTGVGVYSINLINNLSRLSLEEKWKKFTVFTPVLSAINKNIKTIQLSRFLQSSKYGKLAAFSRFLWNTFYYPIQARKFDLLISPTTHGSFLLKNQIITIHDLISLRYKNISTHQRFYFKYLLQFLINRAKVIIAVSESTKKDIMFYFKCPEDKIKVIYNGYDDTHYFPLTENKNSILKQYGLANYFLAIGPTYPHKNFEMLINTYSELDDFIKKKYPLVIAGGKDKYVFTLKELVKKRGLERNVFFIGYVPVQLMPPLYREAYALIFPSLYEGFGIPLLEAMACGCPVIVSNTSSMPEVCGDAVVYFDPLQKPSLLSAIKKMILEIEVRNELIKKGIVQAKKFSWKQMAQTFNIMIEEIFTNNKILSNDRN